ncbi:MAG: hypothetical protein QXY40_09510 [Candidatus Methanomethylicia archaeon]
MKVFLAPGLFKNIKRSIADGVNVNELNIKDSSLKERILKFYGAGPIKLWALKESLRDRWTSIDNEDYILFYHAGKFIYAARVSFKYPFTEESKQVEAGSYLAESIWGRDVDGKTWPYLFFLEDVREIDLPLSKLNELTGYNLKAVAGFMKIRKEKAQSIMEYLQQIYLKPPIKPPSKPLELLQHDEIVDAIYALGELIGYKPEKRWRHERYEFDVVWHKPPRIGPKYVFEVHLRGSLEAALLRLKHAYDLWESQIFLVSTEDQLKEAQSKFLGELHELKDKVTLLNIKNIKEFYDFKGKFEWLERKFGLKPT